MARVIPNQRTWLGFAETIGNISAPTAAEVAAATVLTPLLISINASTRGNQVPTPSFDSLFETSVPGTVSASLDADFYRDSVSGNDVAWTTLERGTEGYFILSRFGGTGTNRLPIATNNVEVWPITVVSKTMANMSSGSVMTFTVSCSVPEVPDEDAVVAA